MEHAAEGGRLRACAWREGDTRAVFSSDKIELYAGPTAGGQRSLTVTGDGGTRLGPLRARVAAMPSLCRRARGLRARSERQPDPRAAIGSGGAGCSGSGVAPRCAVLVRPQLGGALGSRPNPRKHCVRRWPKGWTMEHRQQRGRQLCHVRCSQDGLDCMPHTVGYPGLVRADPAQLRAHAALTPGPPLRLPCAKCGARRRLAPRLRPRPLPGRHSPERGASPLPRSPPSPSPPSLLVPSRFAVALLPLRPPRCGLNGLRRPPCSPSALSRSAPPAPGWQASWNRSSQLG